MLFDRSMSGLVRTVRDRPPSNAATPGPGTIATSSRSAPAASATISTRTTRRTSTPPNDAWPRPWSEDSSLSTNNTGSTPAENIEVFADHVHVRRMRRLPTASALVESKYALQAVKAVSVEWWSDQSRAATHCGKCAFRRDRVRSECEPDVVSQAIFGSRGFGDVIQSRRSGPRVTVGEMAIGVCRPTKRRGWSPWPTANFRRRRRRKAAR